MKQTTLDYFLNSKKVLISIGIAFFLTNCIELFIMCLVSLLSRKPADINTAAYFVQSLIIVSSLWFSFRFLKNAPVYIIASSVAIISTLVLSALLFITSFESIKEFALTNFISSFVLIFIWMHLTQNLADKIRALKVGYFSYFIAIECLSLIPYSIRSDNHVIFLLFALIGYKISSVIFELAIKIAFKIFNVATYSNAIQ